MITRTTALRRSVMAATLAVAGFAHADDAITIYTARKIVTMEKSNPQAQAVAVAGKHIISAGTLASVKAALGNRPFTVDQTFKDKVVMPGFLEQHMHPILAAMTLITEVISTEDWDLPEKTYKAARTPTEYRDRLVAADATMGDARDWLYSWGYHPLWHGKLSRAELDKISTTRPIIVWHRSGHEFYLNTAAIEALKLTKGQFEGHGIASTQFNWEEGHWWENAALDHLVPPLMKHMGSPDRMVKGLKLVAESLHQKGVTAFNDPGIYLIPGLVDLYKKVFGDPNVPLYGTFMPEGRSQALAGMSAAEALADVERIVALAPTGKAAMVPRQIKLFVDGAIISQAMQMKDGYLDGHHGEWMMTPELLEKWGKVYWDAGYQLHVHVTGDLGLETLLDMLERRMVENPRPNHRTVIVHFPNSTEEQVERIARLGAIVSANPYYPVGFAEKFAKVGVGRERANVMARNASVIKHGIHLSFHSDLPIAPADPLFLAWSAVNRYTNEGHVVAPEQRIGVDDAMRAITIEAAYSWQRENDLGSIAPGKIANFTVLERDPYAVKPMALKDIPVWGTVFEGKAYPKRTKSEGKQAAAGTTPRGSLAPFHAWEHDDHSGDSCDVARKLMANLAAQYAQGDAAPSRSN